MTELREWGEREYSSALAEMRALHGARRRGEIPDTLILVEHPPVITVGVQGDDGERFPPGVPVHRVERGGKSTYHGPGQLIGYPIVDLAPRGNDVRRFVGEVEEIVIRTLGRCGLVGERIPGRRGVWVPGPRKIASIGVAVEGWVTLHGFALNVSTDLNAFASFHPCGFDPSIMTSMEQELGRKVPLDEVAQAAGDAWAQIFGPAPLQRPTELPADRVRSVPVTG
jgi:lipoyl(octanoyl) transferase